MLNNHGNFIISATSSPTSAEISRQFSPKSLKVNYESLANDNSGRTADGVMHVSFLLERIRKVEIEMPTMTVAAAHVLLPLVQGKVYYLTYWDPLANAEKTIHVYTSTSAGDCYSGIIKTNGLWQGISFNAIELGGEVDA